MSVERTSSVALIRFDPPRWRNVSVPDAPSWDQRDLMKVQISAAPLQTVGMLEDELLVQCPHIKNLPNGKNQNPDINPKARF